MATGTVDRVSAKIRTLPGLLWAKSRDVARDPFFFLAVSAAVGLVIYFGPDIWSLITAIRECDPAPTAPAERSCKALADGGTFKLLSAMVLALAGLLTLAFAHRRSKAMAGNARNMTRQVEILTQQMEMGTRQLEMGRREQLSKRFTEAVKQLGDDKITIRLGGIAGLWAMATESDHAEDRIMVLDVLCAFVRESSRDTLMTVPTHPVIQDTEEITGKPELQILPTDIAIAMKKVMSIGPGFTPKKEYWRDLRRASLVKLEGRQSNFYRTDLSEADLSEADLSEANLSDANLSGANLSEATLTRSQFESAITDETTIPPAEFLPENPEPPTPPAAETPPPPAAA